MLTLFHMKKKLFKEKLLRTQFHLKKKIPQSSQKIMSDLLTRCKYSVKNSEAYLKMLNLQNLRDLKQGKVEHHLSPWARNGTVDHYGVTEIIRPNVFNDLHFAAYNIWPFIYDSTGTQPMVLFMKTTGNRELQYIALPGKGWYKRPRMEHLHLGYSEDVFENRAEKLNSLKVHEYITTSYHPHNQRMDFRWDCDSSYRARYSIGYNYYPHNLYGFEKYLDPAIYAAIGRGGLSLYNLFTINNEVVRKNRLYVFTENPWIVNYFISWDSNERTRALWLLERIDNYQDDKEMRRDVDIFCPPPKDGKNKLRIS